MGQITALCGNLSIMDAGQEPHMLHVGFHLILCFLVTSSARIFNQQI